MLKRLLKKYSSLKVLYNPFPGIDARKDPFVGIFSKELAQDRVKITDNLRQNLCWKLILYFLT